VVSASELTVLAAESVVVDVDEPSNANVLK
jgi:hypothetical protein